jgi:peptidoglycan hydrolase CwlO-like protein
MTKLLIISLLLGCTGLKAEKSCDLAIDACKTLVEAQDTQISHLKQDKKDLEKKLNEESDPLIPNWLWAVMGVIVGGTVVEVLHK